MAAYGVGRYGLGVYGIGEGIQTIPVGRATETDTAGQVGRPRAFALNRATETDSAQALTVKRGQRRIVGQAEETDTARSVYPPVLEARNWSYGVAVGEPTMLWGRTVTELPPGAPDTEAVTNPIVSGEVYLGNGFYTVDDDTGVGAAVGPDRIFVIEWDSYQEDPGQRFSVIWTNDDYSAGGTLWTNTGSPFPAGGWVHTIKVLTTPAAATQVYFTYGGGVAYMSGLSIRSGPIPNNQTLTPATETDSAQPITAGQALYVGQADETDSANPVSPTVPPILVGQADETDTARALTILLRTLVGRATEVDTAQPVTAIGTGDQTILIGTAIEEDTAGVVRKPAVTTARWVLYDPQTTELWTMPINPDSMTPIGTINGYTLSHARTRYGVSSIQRRRELTLDWSGVIRTQAHYDTLTTWASKRHAVELTDHTGRQYRIYITEYAATDRSPIPSAPKRWRYTMKSKVLEVL